MKAVFLNGFSEVDKNEWNELLVRNSTGTIFQSYQWLSVWEKHFGINSADDADGGAKILLVKEGKKLVGAGAFEMVGGRGNRGDKGDRRVRLLGMREVLGKELVTDYGDIIAVKERSEEVWKKILTDIRYWILGIRKSKFQNPNFKIIFDFIREDSVSFKVLPNVARNMGWGVEIKEQEAAPFIDLPKSWDEYLTGLRRSDRHELRRKIRRLEEEKAFRLCSPESLNLDMDCFFRLMRLSGAEKRIFLSREMEMFLREAVMALAKKNWVDLCFLVIDGKETAATLAFIWKNELWLYNSGFDPGYGKLAVGILLKAFLIKRAIEKGLRRFDFLRGDERYKYDLGARERKLYRVEIKILRCGKWDVRSGNGKLEKRKIGKEEKLSN